MCTAFDDPQRQGVRGHAEQTVASEVGLTQLHGVRYVRNSVMTECDEQAVAVTKLQEEFLHDVIVFLPGEVAVCYRRLSFITIGTLHFVFSSPAFIYREPIHALFTAKP
jgi:hypothetical protein